MDEALLLVVVLAPLGAALLTLLLTKKLNGGAGFLTATAAAVSFVSLLFLGGASPQLRFSWFETAGFTLTVGLQLDGLSWFMATLVTGIALPVSIYALGDMARERSKARFFSTLSLFLSAMLALVLADSFILLFAAWEAVGVTSFFLIGFWYGRDAVRAAAVKAFVFTRCGDVGFLLGWLGAFLLVGTTEIDALLHAVETGTLPASTLTLLGLLFFAGAIGKSAQFPLITWLPDAMVGPTPVSALIHSATMVAAGVYLLLRLFPLFAAAPYVLPVVLTIGLATAFIGALVAAAQNDIKRVLAWSTASQLGEMIFAVGLAGPFAALFHLGTHAAFKSTLFLAAGAVDHGARTRELGRLGRLWSEMPVTALVFSIGALALAGFPPFSGFWSEEAILAQAASRNPVFGVIFVFLVFSAGVYIGRAATAVFAPWPGAAAPAARDPGRKVLWPMALLAMAAAGLGWMLTSSLESLQPFSPSAEAGWSWRLAAIAASVAGLALGIWRVRSYGPAPAWGEWSSNVESVLHAATTAPARFAIACANGLACVETWLDSGARALGRATFSWVSRSERWLNCGAYALANAGVSLAHFEARAENRFDASLRELAMGVFRIATSIDRTEGLSAMLDRAAGLLPAAGGRLRLLQSGKLYLYTLAVFLWIFSAGLIGLLAWSFAASG